jgi:RNA polymerase sigma factor (sigma-70 family)
MVTTKVETNYEDLKSIESIIDWFDHHQKSFYILGLSYLSSQQQIEELFYEAICKVHKELSRFKHESSSIDTWITSNFIHICRELSNDKPSPSSSEKVEPRHAFFKALDRLKPSEKDAVVLTYVKGMTKEEAAKILQVSTEKLKESLLHGVQSIREDIGSASTYTGCKEYHENYIDYLEGAMERSEKIDFEVHIYHCQNCQEDLGSFQDVIITMTNLVDRFEDFQVPLGFMDRVIDRLAEKERQRQQKSKKRKKVGVVIASVFAVLIGIGFFTGMFTNLYYTWTEDDEELRAFLQQDFGDRLNLIAESDGVKIKIKSAIADDIQTLILYEIEDTKENNQYIMNFHDGVTVENGNEILNDVANLMYYAPDLELEVNKKEKNVFTGKMSLPPLKKEQGTIKLKIARLQKLSRTNEQAYQHLGYETGEWKFEIPVTKRLSEEYVIDEKTAIEGIPVRIDKLIVAPTATVLQYGINLEQTEKRLEILNFGDLAVNNRKLKVDRYSRSFVDSQRDMSWYTFTTRFDPLFGEKPKEVSVYFESAHLTFVDHETIDLAVTGAYPQTFEYAGSTVTIEKVEVGQPTTVVISNRDIKNRDYEMLQFNIIGGEQDETSSMEMNTEGIMVDKYGNEYDMNESPIAYDLIEQPRYLITVQNIKLHSNNPDEKVIPKRIELYGYNSTKYLDDVVKISIKN